MLCISVHGKGCLLLNSGLPWTNKCIGAYQKVEGILFASVRYVASGQQTMTHRDVFFCPPNTAENVQDTTYVCRQMNCSWCGCQGVKSRGWPTRTAMHKQAVLSFETGQSAIFQPDMFVTWGIQSVYPPFCMVECRGTKSTVRVKSIKNVIELWCPTQSHLLYLFQN